MREPVVCGVSGGVGARTVAFALAAGAGQPGMHRPCDVLVCRATVHSVTLAERHLAATPGHPVLAVVDDGPVPRPARAKLRMLGAHAEAVLHLPWVNRWREISNPYAEASRLAFQSAEQVSKHLRGYHKAVGELVTRLRPLVAQPPPGPRAPPSPPEYASPGTYPAPIHSGGV